VRREPIVYSVHVVYTIAVMYMCCYFGAQFEPEPIQAAAVMSGAMMFGLIIFAFSANSDLTLLGGLIWVTTMVVAMFLIITIFMQDHFWKNFSAAISIIAYGMFLVYDTQKIANGGKGRHDLTIDDYIIGSVFLSADLFIMPIGLLFKRQGEED
jgi:FtsH-binding integral membrane protein